MSNFYGKDMKGSKMKPGFHAGIAADYEFIPNVAIQTGLFFTTKGAKFEKTFGNDKVTNTVNAYYLQMPLHLAYKIDVASSARVVLHAGPYAAYGVGGKYKYDSKFTDVLKNAGIAMEGKTFDKKTGYKPFDAGVGAGIGAEFGSFLVDLGWDMGLLNISQDKAVKIKNQNAYLSVGFRF